MIRDSHIKFNMEAEGRRKIKLGSHITTDISFIGVISLCTISLLFFAGTNEKPKCPPSFLSSKLHFQSLLWHGTPEYLHFVMEHLVRSQTLP